MNTQVRARMDRGDTYQTVHGERGPDDRHATTHFYQNGLPFDGEGHLILDHSDFEADKGDRCSDKAATLRAKAHTLIAQTEKRERKRAARQAEEDRRNPPRRGDRPRADAPAPAVRRAVPPPPGAAMVPTEPRADIPPPPESSVGQVESSVSPANTFDSPPAQTPPADIYADDDEGEEGETGFGDTEIEDDEDDETVDHDAPVKVNMEAFLRGEEDVQWQVLTQEIAVRFKRRVPNMREAIIFMVEDEDGPKVIPKAQLAKKYLKHLD